MTCPAPFIDHTQLKADTTEEQIVLLCEEAVEHSFASVCIPPVFVPQAAELLYGSGVAVGTVIGFPLGYDSTAVKAFATAEAVCRGAGEIDMVINLGWARQNGVGDVGAEVRQVVLAAEGAKVKVILECCYLEDAAKEDLTEAVVAAGAAFVKTSTGFGPSGATVDDVRLLCRAARGRIGVKASGGIRDWNVCRELLQAGATRIGTSSGPAIMEGWRKAELS